MKYIGEYRDRGVVEGLAAAIREVPGKPVKLMEVCGTHTVSISRHGIRELLPEWITLVSGPGCPVCVTPVAEIDRSIHLASREDVIIATFGDLLRVPGSETSLLRQRGEGADIRVVYSAYDAFNLAKKNSNQKVVLLGVGFETTAPTVGAVLQRARMEGVENFSVLSMHKIIPPALEALVQSREAAIDGFICPGHVSTIIGTEPYRAVAEAYHIPSVVAGFEPVDILQAIALLVKQIAGGCAGVEIQYRRGVSPEGNPKARAIMEEVFHVVDSAWRGFGSLPGSGLALRDAYGEFDAGRIFEIPAFEGKEPAGCICGDILKGVKQPRDCPLFGGACVPDNPVGACMVSSEGTCAAHYRYSIPGS